jgi:hypothetical protein
MDHVEVMKKTWLFWLKQAVSAVVVGEKMVVAEAVGREATVSKNEK